MGTYIVEEVTVVRYDYYRTEIFGKEVLEPRYCVNIKVVCRLVHKNDIGVAEQCLCKQYLDLFVTGKTAHLSIHNALVKTESLYQLRSVAFRLPAAELRKFALKLACKVAVLLRKIFFCVKSVLLLHYFIKTGIAHYYRFLYGIIVVCVVVLL